MADNSHIRLGKRVKKSKAHPFGWEYMAQIPPDEPCIVALPGSDADNSKKANGFAKMIEEILKDKRITGHASPRRAKSARTTSIRR